VATPLKALLHAFHGGRTAILGFGASNA
jgi:hypothetical protein